MDMRIAGIAIAAVLIALVASYVTADTDDEGSDVRTDLHVGDYIEYDMTIDTDLSSIQDMLYEPFVANYLSPDVSSFEKTGTEEYTLGDNKIVCDVYELEDIRVLMDPVTGLMMMCTFTDQGTDVEERLVDTNYPLDRPLSEDYILDKYFRFTQTYEGNASVITYTFEKNLGDGLYMMTFAKESHSVSQDRAVISEIEGDFVYLTNGTRVTKASFLELIDFNTFKNALESSGMPIKKEWKETIDTPFGPMKTWVLMGGDDSKSYSAYHVGDRIYRLLDSKSNSFGTMDITTEVISSSLLE